MSVTEELRALEERVTQRLRELRPVLEELKELEAVAQRLGLQVGEAAGDAGQRAADLVDRARVAAGQSGAPAKKRPGASRSRKRAATSVGSRKTAARQATAKPRVARTRRKAAAQPAATVGRGERTEQVRQLIEQQPGLTVREIGTQLQVDPTGLYRVVRQLEQRGIVTKDGPKLTLA